MAKCLVIGGNGFIGSHLVDELLKKGHAVTSFDRYGSGVQMSAPNGNLSTIDGNFMNKEQVTDACNGQDYVFHLVSTTTPATSQNDPLLDIETNIKYSVDLFQTLVNSGVKKVIFLSTGGAIYGNHPGVEVLSEQHTPLPISPYAIGKLTIEPKVLQNNSRVESHYL
jgi:UDP-glucose 4-epimerase